MNTTHTHTYMESKTPPVFTSDVEKYIKQNSAPSTPTFNNTNKNATLDVDDDRLFKVMDNIKGYIDGSDIGENILCKLIVSVSRGNKDICKLGSTTKNVDIDTTTTNNSNNPNTYTIGEEKQTRFKIIDK